MNTSEEKQTVSDEQIQSARRIAGYHSEDLKKECERICREAEEEEKKEYLSLSQEQKEKLKEATNRVVDIDDDEELFPDDEEVNNPIHYQSLCSEANIDCITAMRAAFGDYEVSIWCKLNAFKYNWRSDSKGGNTDIKKAIYYLNKFLELGGCEQ